MVSSPSVRPYLQDAAEGIHLGDVTPREQLDPMDAPVLLTPEEYLRAQFDGPDRDYVDGEVIERNIGELPHASCRPS